jgi:hypothetical protein
MDKHLSDKPHDVRRVVEGGVKHEQLLGPVFELLEPDDSE